MTNFQHLTKTYAAVVAGVVMTACAPLPDRAATRDVLSECLGFGLTPGTVAMERCLTAEDRAARMRVLDEETYGTF